MKLPRDIFFTCMSWINCNYLCMNEKCAINERSYMIYCIPFQHEDDERCVLILCQELIMVPQIKVLPY